MVRTWVTLPVVLLVAGYGGWWVAGRALQPLRDLTVAAESVQAASLDRRIATPAANDEIHRLAAVLNAMFSRLETSFAQARRFAADASHELRTPLTIMQGEVELLLRADGLTPVQETRLLSLQEEIGRLNHITEQLLVLARFDAGKTEPRRERVDLSALVQEAGEDAELLAVAQGIRLSMQIATGIVVSGDPTQLRRLLLNLLQNAVTYNRPAGVVECGLEPGAAAVRLRIANTGSGIPPELRPRIFERFFRSDPSRTKRRGHGLGLSLCQEIALAHGGDIALAAARPDWTEFVVTLPAAKIL